MFSNAWACVIVTDVYNAQIVFTHGFRYVGGVKPGAGFFPGDHPVRHLEALRDDRIHPGFDFLDFFGAQFPGKMVIAFGFFAIDMGTETTLTSEHADHGLIEKVLCGMHGRIGRGTAHG